VFITGCLVGLETIVDEHFKDKVQFRDLVSNVFTFDYILLASILFPLVLVPKLGIMGTSLFLG
jgi:spermidine synthase